MGSGQKSKNKILKIYLPVFLVMFVLVVSGYFFYQKIKDTAFTKKEIVGEETRCKEYKKASEKPKDGWFEAGQDADIMLSGIDFNNTGGPLLFNHPGNIASDGKRLLLADRNNNRVLIWNKLPAANSEPDLVLGQKNFITNNPGKGLDNLNWPVGVATDGTKLVVADTSNDRILIWSRFPKENGQKADIELKGVEQGANKPKDLGNKKQGIGWPWAVWTNGEKLIVASTGTSSVLIWNTFPKENNKEADLVLSAKGEFGTPRSIGSDGKRLMIGDHNAEIADGPGNFFWKEFPTTDDKPYDFFVASTQNGGEEVFPRPKDEEVKPKVAKGEIMWGGAFTPEGKFVVLAGNNLLIWDSFPKSETDMADLVMGMAGGPKDNDKKDDYVFLAGDGSGVAYAEGKLYLGLSNGNKIVVFNSMPNEKGQKPDFAIGSPDIDTNTLETNYFITNGVPATDGKSLLVSSDFDRKLYVWKNIPDQSGACPDIVLPYGGWDNELHDGNFASAGYNELYIWKKLPLNGEKPDLEFRESIGSIKIENLRGVAFDDKYFYLADYQQNKIYIWEGFPSEDKDPKFTIETNLPWRLHSDGKYLVVTSTLDNEGGHIKVFKVDGLSAKSVPTVLNSRKDSNIKTNLPEHAITEDGHFFIADTSFQRVLVWKNVEDFLNKKQADLVLGEENLEDTTPEIGKNKTFWPAGLAYDGSYLWVGEFKFSGRLLRFSAKF